MKRIPRDVRGNELVRLLSRHYGYREVRQTGSHVRVRTDQNGSHSVTIPQHSVLKLGTLASILDEVARHFETTRDDVIATLFP